MKNSNILTQMILDRWNASIINMNNLLAIVTDEQLEKEIVPGKNRGIYLLGHLIAAHDEVLRLLDMGVKLFPELFEAFLKSPDKAVANIPNAAELRNMWQQQVEVMNNKFAAMQAEQWLEKHTAVSAEDFAAEPHRNKLNIVLTRTTHLQYHLGQLALLK